MGTSSRLVGLGKQVQQRGLVALAGSATSAQLTSDRMWSLLLAQVHPDAGGSEELFFWAQALQEEVRVHASPPESDVASRIWEEFVAAHRAQHRAEPRPKEKYKQPNRNKNRIPFDTNLSFEELTDHAVKVAGTLADPHGEVVPLLLDGCELSGFGCVTAFVTESRTVGAYYARLADVGHALGFDGWMRSRLYKFAERVPLSDLHAVHMVNRARRLAHESPKIAARIRIAACRGV